MAEAAEAKKRYLFLLCSAALARLSVMILTAPSAMRMYLLPFCLMGYPLLAYKLLIHFSKKALEGRRVRNSKTR